MIAHCIGGPWHGQDRQVEDGKHELRGYQLPKAPLWCPDDEPTRTITYDVVEYRRRGVAAGYDVFEYVEPTAEVEIVIRKRVPKSKVEETRAELVRTLGLPEGGRLYYSGPARD